jgi:uncharacterized membrane protein
LKLLKLDLKKWNEEVFGNIKKWKKALLVELHDLDIIAKERSPSVEENARKVEIIRELERTRRANLKLLEFDLKK